MTHPQERLLAGFHLMGQLRNRQIPESCTQYRHWQSAGSRSCRQVLHRFCPSAVILKSADTLFYSIGNFSEFSYRIKTLREDAHCGVRGRCRNATAAGASFASETLCSSIGNFSEFSYRTKPSGGCALRRTR